MVRQVLRRGQLGDTEVWDMTRPDQDHFRWLVENGFVAAVGRGRYEVTEKGKGAAALGEYEWEPRPPGDQLP
jgi:hypothetical protein